MAGAWRRVICLVGVRLVKDKPRLRDDFTGTVGRHSLKWGNELLHTIPAVLKISRHAAASESVGAVDVNGGSVRHSRDG